jgi:translocation and assembly module TamB
MRKPIRYAVYTTAILAAMTMALVLLVIGIANTDAGRRSIASLVDSLSGGRVSIAGLSGRIPDRLRVAHIELRDARGVWLTAEDVVLDWSPLALLKSRFEAARLTAARVMALRIPMSQGDDSQIAVNIHSLSLPLIETKPAVSGHAARFNAGGSVHYASLKDWSADLAIARQDEPATYSLRASFANGYIMGRANITEQPDGLLAALLGFENIGTIAANASANRHGDANAIAFRLAAGPMSASGDGTINVSAQTLDVDFLARAPHMDVRPDLSWQSLVAEGQAHGQFHRPDIDAMVEIAGLMARESRVETLKGAVTGQGGDIRFSVNATGLHLAGETSNLFARTPIALAGTVNLATLDRPFHFTLSHPLLSAEANGQASPLKARVTLRAPDLAPFGEVGGADIAGKAALTLDIVSANDVYRFAASGTIDATGDSLFSRLTGRNARLTIATTVAGTIISISDAHFEGAGANARVSGTMRQNKLDFTSTLALTDVSQFNKNVMGEMRLQIRATGPLETAQLSATGTADLATAGIKQQRLTFEAHATGLPQPQTGNFRVTGNFDSAPVAVSGAVRRRRDMALLVNLDQAEWKSLRGQGMFAVPNSDAVSGTTTLTIGDLRDVGVFIDTPLQGSADATLDLTSQNGTSSARVTAEAHNVVFENAAASGISLGGAISTPFSAPSLNLTVRVSGVTAAGFIGDATGKLAGSLDKLNVAADSQLADKNANPIHLSAAGIYDDSGKSFVLSALEADYREQRATLVRPARIDFSRGLAIDNVLIAAGGGSASLKGRITPLLSLDATLDKLPANSLAAFVPASWQPQGTLSGSASLSGTLAAPLGTIVLQGRGLRSGAVATGIAPVSLDARGNLHSDTLSIEGEIGAGKSVQLKVSGNISLPADNALDLRAQGKTDLAIFNPILSADGRKLLGEIALDASLRGSLAMPEITGSATLSGGEVQDVPRGFRLHDIAAVAESDGHTIRLTRLNGVAGQGTVTASGTVQLAQGTPVDLTFTARNARPLVSDRFAVTLDSDLKLTGQLFQTLTLAGSVNLTRGDINLPDRFPPSIAVLDVRRIGEVTVSSQRETLVRLDIRVSSPGRLFIRGRGVDAEVQGQLRVAGTLNAPQFVGGFDLRRGTLAVLGQNLDFTRGMVTFNGAGVKNTIDPMLDLIATDRSAGVDVTVAINGPASAPKIELSSSPNLPQDEILSHILFQQSTASLSPLQLAQIAQAAVSLTDTGAGFDPITGLRKSLGLDRLAVGSVTPSGATESAAAVTAGKYVARGIYLGATQAIGGGTQAEVQIDVTKNLKAIGTVDTGIGTSQNQRPSQSEGSTSFGLKYQFEY